MTKANEVYTFHAGEVEAIAKQEIIEIINKLKPLGFNYRHMFIYNANNILSYIDTWTALTPIEKLIGNDPTLILGSYPLEVIGAFADGSSWKAETLFSTYSPDEIRAKLKEIIFSRKRGYYDYYAVSFRAKATPKETTKQRGKQKTFVYNDFLDKEMASFYILDPNNKFRMN